MTMAPDDSANDDSGDLITDAHLARLLDVGAAEERLRRATLAAAEARIDLEAGPTHADERVTQRSEPAPGAPAVGEPAAASVGAPIATDRERDPAAPPSRPKTLPGMGKPPGGQDTATTRTTEPLRTERRDRPQALDANTTQPLDAPWLPPAALTVSGIHDRAMLERAAKRAAHPPTPAATTPLRSPAVAALRAKVAARATRGHAPTSSPAAAAPAKPTNSPPQQPQPRRDETPAEAEAPAEADAPAEAEAPTEEATPQPEPRNLIAGKNAVGTDRPAQPDDVHQRPSDEVHQRPSSEASPAGVSEPFVVAPASPPLRSRRGLWWVVAAIAVGCWLLVWILLGDRGQHPPERQTIVPSTPQANPAQPNPAAPNPAAPNPTLSNPTQPPDPTQPGLAQSTAPAPTPSGGVPARAQPRSPPGQSLRSAAASSAATTSPPPRPATTRPPAVPPEDEDPFRGVPLNGPTKN